MAEEPKKEDRGTQETEQKDNIWGHLKEFFLANPTVVLSLLYLYVTAVGMLYSARFYAIFGINVFDYAEIGDFLLAAFRNPVALPLAGAQLLAAIVYAYVYLPRSRSMRTEMMDEVQKAEQKAMRQVFIYIILTILLFSVLAPVIVASQAAFSRQNGKTPAVDVRYRSYSESSVGQVTEPGLQLIGATQKAVFFYDVADKRTLIIPQSQIVSIEVPE